MPTKPPLPIQVLLSTTFDAAFDMLHMASSELACSPDHDVRFGQGFVRLVMGGDDELQQHAMREYASYLSQHGHAAAATAWQMIACVPEKPESYALCLPNAQAYLSAEMLDPDADPGRVKCAGDAMAVWWQCASGAHGSWDGTTFSLVQDRLQKLHDLSAEDPIWLRKQLKAKVAAAEPLPMIDAGPSVTVMKREPSVKLTTDNAPYKRLMFGLPLVVVSSVANVRAQLISEFPHAGAAIELLTRDLRDGQPVKLKPSLLVGPAGSGKSLLARRFAEVLGLGTYRFDAASSGDNSYGGISRTWSTSMPSVPARAILQTSTGNPCVFVDELDKAATSTHNGSLTNSLMPFLEAETASRYRDPSLEVELDLGRVIHLATANDEKALPGPLKDRYRLIRMPAPTLRHLPALAANVVAAIARENDVEVEMYGELQADELDNIGQAWAARGFSMRQLQKIVHATLDARDACNAYAPRH